MKLKSWTPSVDNMKCKACNGWGKVRQDDDMANDRVCSKCHGTGKK